MHRILSVIAIVAAAWTVFAGAWGLIEAVTGAVETEDLVDAQGWMASALLTAGIAGIALAVRDFGPRYR